MITIVGAGKVGASAASEILRYRISDVTLIDIAENLAKGEALDMMQAAPAIEFDGKIRGENKSGSCDTERITENFQSGTIPKEIHRPQTLPSVFSQTL